LWITNDFGLFKSDLDIVNWIKETDFGSTEESFIDDAGNLYIPGWGHDRIGLHILPALEEEWIFKELPDNHLKRLLNGYRRSDRDGILCSDNG